MFDFVTYLGCPPQAIGLIVATALLLCVSAMVSGAEAAYFSLSPANLRDIKQRGTLSANGVIKLLKDPDTLLATILVVNNAAVASRKRQRHDCYGRSTAKKTAQSGRHAPQAPTAVSSVITYPHVLQPACRPVRRPAFGLPVCRRAACQPAPWRCGSWVSSSS